MTRKTMNERRMAGANKQISQLTEALGAERKQRLQDDENATQIIATNRRVIIRKRAENSLLSARIHELLQAQQAYDLRIKNDAGRLDKLNGKLLTARAIVIVLAAATVINIVLDAMGIPA